MSFISENDHSIHILLVTTSSNPAGHATKKEADPAENQSGSDERRDVIKTENNGGT